MAESKNQTLRDLEALLGHVDDAFREAQDVRTRVQRSMARRPVWPDLYGRPGGGEDPADNEQTA